MQHGHSLYIFFPVRILLCVATSPTKIQALEKGTYDLSLKNKTQLALIFISRKQ